MANYGTVTLHEYRKKIASTYELISTAYHEAGHAVYGLLHFMRINSVSVFENPKSKRIEGFTHYDNYFHGTIQDPQLISNIIKNEICISYAGLSAEKYFFKTSSGSNKFPLFLRDGSSDDTLSAAALIRKFNLAPSGKKRYLLKQKLINETSVELQLHWEAVVIVAQELFQKKKLCYNELKQLLLKKSSNKKFWKKQLKQIDYIFNNANSLDEKELKSIMFC